MSRVPDLASVIAAFRGSLPPEIPQSVFRIDHLDRIGLPVVQANLLLPGEPATTGHGYGATRDEAEVGAWGELCEEQHVHEWARRTPHHWASYAELVHRYGVAYVADPLTLCLPAGSAFTPDMPLDWVRGERLGGDWIWIPREWVVAYSYQMDEPPRLIVPITNGLGAGLDRPHAIVHGLLELLQRDGNVLTYRALDQGVVVNLASAPDDLRGIVSHLSTLGIDVTVKLACTDFGLTNVYAVGQDRGDPAVPIELTACGEASHPDRERAVRKALLEFVGSRARKAATHGPLDLLRRHLPSDFFERELAVHAPGEERRALTAMADWIALGTPALRDLLRDTVFSRRSEIAYAALPTVARDAVASSADRLALVANRLKESGLDILWVDCSLPDSDVVVAKVVVPGLESETMSYHRIGWRGVRRLRERNDPLICDAPRDGARRVCLQPYDEERAGGAAWFDCARADAVVGGLYPLYREPNLFAAQTLVAGRAAAS